MPRRVLGDNARALVVARDRVAQTVTFHWAYLAFCRDGGVEPRACQPYRARIKGKCESGVKFVKRNALAGHEFASFATLEVHLADWMREAEQLIHGTTHEPPRVRFEREERRTLQPLPARPLPYREQVLQHRVAHDALVDIDTVRYSVPHRLVRDVVEQQEVDSKQRKRIVMGIQIAHFPAVKMLADFDFRFQPSIDTKLVRELATGRFIAQATNVLIFGPPRVGKTRLAVGLGRAAVETGHSTLFTTTTALLANLSRAENEGQLAEKLRFYAKPKLLIIDALGYLPFEKRSAHLFFQLVARRYEHGSTLLTTNKLVVLARATG